MPWLALVLAGCGAEPFEYHPQTEIPEGPGMLSGEEGAFLLYSDKKKKAEKSSEEFREFQDFQEFRRWKESDQNTAEYREFQEWREWKTYKTWKEGQPK